MLFFGISLYFSVGQPLPESPAFAPRLVGVTDLQLGFFQTGDS